MRVVLAPWREFERPGEPARSKGLRWLLLGQAGGLKEEEGKSLALALAADEQLAKG